MSRCINGLCRAVPVSPLLLAFFFFFFFSSFSSFSSACSNGNCQMLDSCSTATDCVSGLYCGDCPAVGRTKPICTRGQATIPTSIINGLPFNKYTWLMTHNAFSNANAPPLPGVERITFFNQEDTITNQLRNGVRGLMLDMYDFNNDVWLCHSLRGQCFNFTAFEPAINTLKEVEAFLSQNPTEIVTIIIEDYVHRPKGLSTLFTSAGLDKYWFPVSKMPRKGEDWPTVTDMVQENHRLLVFTSVAAKEDEEGVAYQWRYMVENESGDPGVKRGSCPNRKESQPLNSKSSSLFLMNYFPTYPVEKDACKEHSAPLAEMVGTCIKAGGNRMPNFLAVNFYMRSDGGGVFEVLDRMNGPVLCGCETLAACQPGAAYGSCKNVTLQTRAPMDSTTGGYSGGGTYSGSVQFSRSLASVVSPPNTIVIFCFSWLPLLMFLL